MISKQEELDFGGNTPIYDPKLDYELKQQHGLALGMKTFASGAKSTVKKPRYDLVPQRAVALCAGRFEYGASRHGERNYLKGASDPEFITDRVNHLIEHAMKFAESRKSSDLAAILCNAAILAELGADKEKDGADGKGQIPA